MTTAPKKTAPRKSRSLNRSGAITGACARFSTSHSAPPKTSAAPAPSHTSALCRPSARASMSVAISVASASVASAWPPTSSFFFAPPIGVSCKWHDSQKPSAHKGTLTQKIDRQPTVDTIRPPSTGPSAMEIEPAAVQ